MCVCLCVYVFAYVYVGCTHLCFVQCLVSCSVTHSHCGSKTTVVVKGAHTHFARFVLSCVHDSCRMFGVYFVAATNQIGIESVDADTEIATSQ